jgi:hypothetical protein
VTTDRARIIAKLVDDAVISVHRQVGATHGEQIRSNLDRPGLESVGLLIDVAEFLLADSFSFEVMKLRFRYHHPDDLQRGITSWSDSGLIGRNGAASPGLRGLLRLVLDLRDDVAQKLWQNHTNDFSIVRDGALSVVKASDGPLTARFRALPVPGQAALSVHHLLTGVRYHRADAHASAWQGFGLRREEIVALTRAWRGQQVEPPAGLAERGWFDGDELTQSGREARDRIELVTNQRAGPAFAGFDDEGWLTWFEAVANLATAESQSV